jgi:hypothetical protein
MPTLLVFIALVAGFLYYVHHFPDIFDVTLFDESNYMHRGVVAGLLDFTNYEWSPLYSLFYRVLSLVVGDPLHLYMAGGLLVLFIAFLSGSLSVYLLSRNPVLTILLGALSIFSSVYLISPRAPFLAIAIMGLGLPFALGFCRFSDKAAVLTLIAFLLTFVRPEFIASFYLMLLIAVISYLQVLRLRWKGRPRVADVLSGSTAPVLCFAGIAALALAWSFPVPPVNDRAFGQQYAYRYVTDHKLPMNPWQNWTHIIAGEFPGASTVDAAFDVSPGKVLHFYLRNVSDLFLTMYGYLSESVNTYPLFFALALVLLLGGILWRLSVPSPVPSWVSEAQQNKIWGDLLLIAVFGISPLASTVFVYPRPHNVIMIGFVCCLLLARSLRGFDPPHASIFAAVLGTAFLLSIRPLPSVGQPRVEIIRMLRGLPPVGDMLEDDGGWCYYIRPPCNAHILSTLTDKNALRSLIDSRVDAILVSPQMRRYEESSADTALSLLLNDPHPHGWTAYPLTTGYSILYRRSKD